MMALRTVIGSESMPEGAVRVSEQEALAYQKAVVRDWKSESDVYGGHLACTSVSFTSIITLAHFNSAFNLGKKGNFTMFVSGTVFPMALTWLSFNKYVTDNVLLMKPNCPLCQQLRYGLLQITYGLVYPTVVGLINGSRLASFHSTYNVPNEQKSLKDLFRFYYSFVKQGSLKFQAIGAFHLFFALLLPYLQSIEMGNVIRTLEEINYEKNLEK